jgi:SOS-response transcriptional repressor LexA
MSGRPQGTTARQLAVVEAIREARRRHPAYGPSIREIAAAVGTSTNDVASKIARLERDGVVVRDLGVARSIRIRGEAQS